MTYLGAKGNKKGINFMVIALLIIIGIFSYRVIKILDSNRERGGYAYVQLLNFGIPCLESEVYNSEDYVENNLSIKQVCLEAIGASKINFLNIIGGEVSFFDSEYTLPSNVASINLSPFEINDSSINKVEVVDNDLKKVLDQSKPEVLIYHTHTTEGYGEGSPDSDNEDLNVVGVGNEITKELENNYGISVIHDKTNHSVSYVGCYQRSNETVSSYLKKYGDFKLVIDLHRDAVDNKASVTTKINNENVARIMMVTAKNSSRYNKNKETTEYIFNKMEELYPGFTRTIYTYNHGLLAFNQGLSDGSILIECGSNANTPDEAKNSAKYIARAIAEYINRK